MKFPYIQGRNKTEQQIVRFSGLDYRVGAADGTLADSKNLSSALFPGIYQRGGRSIYGEYDSPTSIFSREKLCVVDGSDFIYDGEKIGNVTPGEKQMAVVNTKLVIFPDKMYFDLQNKEFKTLEPSVTALPNTAVFTKNTLKLTPNPAMHEISINYGRYYDSRYRVYCRYYDSVSWSSSSWEKTNQQDSDCGSVISFEEDDVGTLMGKYMIPSKTENNVYEVPVWARESSGDGPNPENMDGVYGIVNHVKYRQKDNSNMEVWTVSLQLYDGSQKNQLMNQLFKVGDAVTISGCTGDREKNNQTLIVRAVSEDTLTFDENVFAEGSENATITVKRVVPDLEYICESENRLWGVKGTDIYGSALGDPGNFDVFDGLTTDSFRVAVGSEGPFTGCIGYSTGVLFWKEKTLHRLVGSTPKDYQLYSYTLTGLQKGSWRSMEIINEVLFYKASNGVYAYQGGTPVLVSEVFGNHRFTEASAGTDGSRYYVSMKDSSGAWGLYVYDIQNGLWVKEDESECHYFAQVEGKVHFLSGSKVYVSENAAFDGEWYAHLNPMNETVLNRKGYSKIGLRMQLSQDAWVKVERRSGPKTAWEQVWASPDSHSGVVEIPILPYFSDALELKISGRGNCLLESMVRTFDVVG